MIYIQIDTYIHIDIERQIQIQIYLYIYHKLLLTVSEFFTRVSPKSSVPNQRPSTISPQIASVTHCWVSFHSFHILVEQDCFPLFKHLLHFHCPYTLLLLISAPLMTYFLLFIWRRCIYPLITAKSIAVICSLAQGENSFVHLPLLQGLDMCLASIKP